MSTLAQAQSAVGGKNIVKVGLLAESHPFHTWPKAGQPQGYDIEMLNRLAQVGGFEFQYVRFAQWDQLQEALAAGAVDLVTSTAMTPQRAQWMRFTRHYASMPQAFAGNQRITSVPAAPDLAGRRLAVGRAFATEAVAAERFPLAMRIAYGSERQALDAVAAGEADFVFGAAAGLRALIAERADPQLAILRTFGFPEGQRRLASKLDRVNLIAELDVALARIAPSEFAQWHQRWIGRWEDAAIVNLPRAEGVAPLKVGYFADEYPYTYTGRDGQAAGVAIELLKATLDRAGLQLANLQPYSLSQGLEALRTGSLDMMLGLTDTAERQTFVRFVGPYHANPVVLVSREYAQITSLDQLSGRRLAMRTAYFAEPFLRGHYPSIEVIPCDYFEACLEIVSEGRAEAALFNLQGVIDRLDVGKHRTLRVTGMVNQLQDEENLGLSKARAELAPRLRDALHAAMQLDLPRIEREWVEQEAKARIDWSDVTRALKWAAAALLLLGGVWFWHQRSLKRQIVQTQAARSQSDHYLAFMAHEVRNSLQSVAGAMALLRNSDAPNEKQKPLLDALNRSSRATLGLLNDLLDRHRLQAGAMALTLRPESIESTLQFVIDEVRPAAGAKGLSLHFEAQTPVAGWWKMDALRVQQVLRNLLVNAVKFSHRGTITVRTRLDGDRDDPHAMRLHVDVIDQGVGLSPQLHQALFVSMVSSGGDRPGSGLGLTLSRELARAMGGDLTVQSPADPANPSGAGACFTFTVRVQAGEAQQPQQGATTVQRVLVVEDSPVYSLLLKEAFLNASIAPQTADSLAAARDALIASVAGAGSLIPAFDLVVADTNLGDGHVRELLAFMREAVRPGVRMPPVICISADFSEQDQHELRESGALDLLPKESDVAPFVQRVLAAYAGAAVSTPQPG